MNETNSNLEFRKIASLDFLYEINSNGTILRNVKSKKQIRIKLDTHHSVSGYYAAFVRFRGRPVRLMAAHLVAECWLGRRPDGMQVDHIDRNSRNNDYRNLRYVTVSEQMRNRDHGAIVARGSANLAAARAARAKPVRAERAGEILVFASLSACADCLAARLRTDREHIRERLKRRRGHILGYDVVYLNAETGHDGPTGQGTVHASDLTGDYRTAFNEGKQQEADQRVLHTGVEACR